MIWIFTLVACYAKTKPAQIESMIDKQGHRGCRGLMPENTIEAMIKAIDLGVNTLEMDVVISKDLKVVVSHDAFMSAEFMTKPNGKPVLKREEEQFKLYEMNYEEIQQFDAGLLPHPRFPQQQKMKVHKPLLSSLIDSTEKYAHAKGKSILYNIEIKSKPEGDFILHPPIPKFADAVVELLMEKGIVAKTTMQSFDKRVLKYVHQKYPTISTALLVESYDLKTVQEHIAELGFTPSIYSPAFILVNEKLVNYCHANGMKVIPWTVNDLNTMKKLIGIGVDGIITDYPNLFEQL